jgi:4-hydroxybenzoyl-CoA reductase subunit beta
VITLPSFALDRPRTLPEALRILDDHRGAARVIAGGTDLVVGLRQRLEAPARLVALGRIHGLDGIAFTPGMGLRVGALTTVHALAVAPLVRALFPVLARAAAAVAAPTIRRAGTVGGNLCLDTRCSWYNQSPFWRSACGGCLKKDGDLCHVAPGSSLCWAVYSGDLAPAFLALDAVAVLVSVRGERLVPLWRFFLEDGLRRVDLAADEILTEVRVPSHRAGLYGVYRKLRVREALDFPLAGAAVAGRLRDGRFEDVAVALTAVGPRPFLVEGAREILQGLPATDEDAIDRAARLARRVANPMRTGGAYGPAHRRHRVGLFVRDALREIRKAGILGTVPEAPLGN